MAPELVFLSLSREDAADFCSCQEVRLTPGQEARPRAAMCTMPQERSLVRPGLHRVWRQMVAHEVRGEGPCPGSRSQRATVARTSMLRPSYRGAGKVQRSAGLFERKPLGAPAGNAGRHDPYAPEAHTSGAASRDRCLSAHGIRTVENQVLIPARRQLRFGEC